MRFSHLSATLVAIIPLSGAAHAASVTAVATATVVENITVANLQPLNFGHITPTAGGGSVTISTNNKRSVAGGVQLGPDAYSRATFKVQGTPGKSYSIHTPSEQTFVSSEASSDPSLTNRLTVNRFTVYSVNASSSGGDGKLGNGGQDDVYLGGTLVVPANAVPGVYSGLVPITVSY